MVDPHSDTTASPSAGPSRESAGPSRSPPAEPASFRPAEEEDVKASGGPGPEARPEPREGKIDFTHEGGDMAAAGHQTMLASVRLWEQALEPFQTFLSSMTRWSDEFWREAASGLRPVPFSRFLSPAPLLDLPSIDVKELADAYVVSVELPGLTDGDVSVSTERDMLRIRGQKAEDQDAATQTYRRSERWFGHFERIFPLPPGADADRMTTSMRDGVLEIVLPKLASAAEPPQTGVRH
jgi:HSP20 family protein